MMTRLTTTLVLLLAAPVAAPFGSTCDPVILDLDGHDICTVSYPDNFIRISDVHAGFPAGCGGAGTTVGIGYSSWPYVDFKSVAAGVAVGDTISVRYVGWASGSTGSIQIKVSVSNDGVTWLPCGTAPGRNFLGNSTVDAVTCTSPLSAANLYVRLETVTLSPALIFLRSCEIEVPELCPTCQADQGFDGPGGSVLSICDTGGTATLAVEGAPANTTGFLLASLQSNPTFVWDVGAVLEPLPVQLILPFSTGLSGEFVIPGVPLTDAAGPFSVYLQSVVVDVQQTMGYGVSNSVRLDITQ